MRVLLETENQTILAGLRAKGVFPESPCNGKGKCGKCKIRILRGDTTPASPQEEAFLSDEEKEQNVRLACMCIPKGPVEVDTLELMEDRKGDILLSGELPDIVFDPAVTAVKVCREEDGAGIQTGAAGNRAPVSSDPLCPKDGGEEFGSALCGSIFKMTGREERPVLSVLRRMPSYVKKQEFYAVYAGGRLIDLAEKPDLYGLAVDIGTTTVAVSLVDLNTGKSVGEDGFVNPQKAFGLDVLSRIHYDIEHPGGAMDLQKAIASAISNSAGGLAEKAGVSTASIYEAVIGGNATMLHALAGVPLGTLGRAPYRCIFTHGVTIPAAELGMKLNPEAAVYCIPSVSTYIGGDIVSGAVATRLDAAEDTVLFIDIGTNGEMILSRRGEMFSCSCAAGPALEGMNISCGMRAEPGAIEHVSFRGETSAFDVIGNRPPKGLCGSGILETVSEAVKHGLVARTGRISGNHPLCDTDAAGKRRIVLDGEAGIFVTQEDIRQVQLCKGAILSGVLTLLCRLDLSPDDVDRVLVAGQFGKHLDPESLTGAGLLPASLKEKISYVGNASQTGAHMCLLSREERSRAESIGQKVSYIELSVSPGYDRLFTKCMQFG